MTTALIGSTGFVGGNLARQTRFDDGYHSRNITDIAGRRYDLLVCAGLPAEKWRANQDPETDRAALERLTGALGTVAAARVVLISTVDVYPSPAGVDEDTPIDPEAGHPYGRHRHALERFVTDRFRTHVIRLPGLFGPGLKKNVVFDLLHRRAVAGLAGASRHQYYDLARLWQDIERIRTHELPLVNLATEPVTVEAIAIEAFGIPWPGEDPAARVVAYDMRTRHAGLLGGAGAYLEDAATVLARIRRFVEAEGWVRP